MWHFFLYLFLFTQVKPGLNPLDDKIRGLSFVGTPRVYTENPMTAVRNSGSNYLAIIPYGFTMKGSRDVIFDSPRQWWGETTKGVDSTILLAREAQLGIMLKPQIYMPGQWVGELDFDKEEDWKRWEASYRQFILHWVKLAQKNKIEIVCIGTEFKRSVIRRQAYWCDLIEEIRELYDGQITYSANWDNYQNIGFWDQLDYIGISNYIPLSEQKTPSTAELVRAWEEPKSRMRALSEVWNKPILFTEFGYLSVDACASRNWLLEDRIHDLEVNEPCQANAINAILQAFSNEDFWAGGFIWKWFPNGHGHEGYVDKDYTPQNKEALNVIKKWFQP